MDRKNPRRPPSLQQLERLREINLKEAAQNEQDTINKNDLRKILVTEYLARIGKDVPMRIAEIFIEDYKESYIVANGEIINGCRIICNGFNGLSRDEKDIYHSLFSSSKTLINQILSEIKKEKKLK